MKKRYRGKSKRLPGYDYSQPGKYFITICTKNHSCIFGRIEDNKTNLNQFGRIAKKYWIEIPEHFTNTVVDEFVIMPNHIHGIIIIKSNNDKNSNREYANRKPKTVSTIIGSYKAAVSKTINQIRNQNNSIWHSNFYDHIIRTYAELNKIREYIKQNPSNWGK